MFDDNTVDDLGVAIPARYFIWPLVTLFGGNMLLGVLVQLFGKKDNSWIDAWWSLSFLLPNVVILVMRAVESNKELDKKDLSSWWI